MAIFECSFNASGLLIVGSNCIQVRLYSTTYSLSHHTLELLW